MAGSAEDTLQLRETNVYKANGFHQVATGVTSWPPLFGLMPPEPTLFDYGERKTLLNSVKNRHMERII